MIEDKTESEKLLQEHQKATIRKINAETKSKNKTKVGVADTVKKAWKAIEKL